MVSIPFTSFHSRTTQLPAELTEIIIQYAEPCTSLLGQPGVSYPPIAYVSSVLRTIYLQQMSRFDFGIGQRPLPGRPARIGETLNFSDLKALAKFLATGPGRRDGESFQGQHLANIKFIRIVYRDDWAVAAWQHSARYAYEAFELLVANFDQMSLERLQICIPSYATFGIDSPGVWSLLKIRGLKAVILSSRRGTIDPTVRSALKKRLCWSKSRSWIPLGLENPGPGDWHTHVSQEGPIAEWKRQ
ncbi:hypothetical protein DL98DRAFT_593475 [Cadophora sp. DSE1049]|nr:hypothetical protein DL98DRAFT_593475 [Cadophora sp. DSE1049]